MQGGREEGVLIERLSIKWPVAWLLRCLVQRARLRTGHKPCNTYTQDELADAATREAFEPGVKDNTKAKDRKNRGLALVREKHGGDGRACNFAW